MALIIKDRIRDTSTTTGTGALTLSGTAPIAYLPFSSVCAVADICEIVIVHQTANEFEVCEATYSAFNTLTRGTVLSSSNAGSAVSFSAGTKDVILTVPARNARAQMSFMKNRIVNGAMAIDQENEGASVAVSTSTIYHSLDSWIAFGTTGFGAYTTQRSTVSAANQALTGQSWQLRFTTTTASASPGGGEAYLFWQYIEGNLVNDIGFGASGAKALALSFWVRSSLTGTFGGAVQNGSQSRSFPFTFTINTANTFEYKSIIIPGDTTGTWGATNTTGMLLLFDIGCGGLAGTAGVWQAGNLCTVSGATRLISTNAATLDFTGVQLEVNSGSTPFEARSIATELTLCQRYYQKTYSQGTVPGTVTQEGAVLYYTSMSSATIAGVGGFIALSVEMRAAPTVTFYSTATGVAGKARDITASADVNATSANNGTHCLNWSAVLNAASAAAFLKTHVVSDARL